MGGAGWMGAHNLNVLSALIYACEKWGIVAEICDDGLRTICSSTPVTFITTMPKNKFWNTNIPSWDATFISIESYAGTCIWCSWLHLFEARAKMMISRSPVSSAIVQVEKFPRV